jgi:hypothetical protein
VSRPGTYRVAIRYTPYWSGRGVCIEPAKDGMFDVQTGHAGIVRLRFAVTPGVALATITGRDQPCTSAH